MKRVLTAAVGIPLLLALIFWASNRQLRWALAFVALLCLSEFLKLAEHYRVQPMRLAAYLSGAWVVAGEPAPGAVFLLGVTLLLLTLAMRGGRELSGSLTSVAATLLGIVYAAAPFRLAGDLHADSPHWLCYTLLLNWIGDAAAYYVGRLWGTHALSPRISPGKTWEGAAGSFVAAVAAGALYLRRFLPHGPRLVFAFAISALVNLTAQVGDLAESALKRGAGVKDSGTLLPGHGGVLDRLDGVLFSIPVVYLTRGR